MSSARLEVFEDAAALAHGAADRLARAIDAALAARRRASLVLAGGSTPLATYGRLVERRVDWRWVDIFFGDERCVEPTDPASNYRRARQSLLEPAAVPSERIHRMRGELGPAKAAEDYEHRLRSRFSSARPAFDVVLLGVGTDGHTASLFPSGVDDSKHRWVLPTRSPQPPRDRVSLSFEALRGAARTVFLVSGPDKAAIVGRILGTPEVDLPAARVAREAADPLWMLDRSAAAELST